MRILPADAKVVPKTQAAVCAFGSGVRNCTRPAAHQPCSLRIASHVRASRRRHAEEGMLFVLQEDPDRETGANESVPSCLHLRGKLNVGALEDALALIVQRHEVLHARYTMRHGEVLQVSASLAISPCQNPCRRIMPQPDPRSSCDARIHTLLSLQSMACKRRPIMTSRS